MKYTLNIDFRDHEPEDETVRDEVIRIAEMITEGFTSGDLIGDNYNGWWSFDAIDS